MTFAWWIVALYGVLVATGAYLAGYRRGKGTVQRTLRASSRRHHAAVVARIANAPDIEAVTMSDDTATWKHPEALHPERAERLRRLLKENP